MDISGDRLEKLLVDNQNDTDLLKEYFFFKKRANLICDISTNRMKMLFLSFCKDKDWKNARFIIKHRLYNNYLYTEPEEKCFDLAGRSFTAVNIIDVVDIDRGLEALPVGHTKYEERLSPIFRCSYNSYPSNPSGFKLKLCPLNYNRKIEQAFGLTVFDTYFRGIICNTTWLSKHQETIRLIFDNIILYLNNGLDEESLKSRNIPLLDTIKKDTDVNPLTCMAIMALSLLEPPRFFRDIFSEIQYHFRIVFNIHYERVLYSLNWTLLNYLTDEEFKYYPAIVL
jgi:hypothetical protein